MAHTWLNLNFILMDFFLGIELSWSEEIPLEWDYIGSPIYPDGALIDVKFKCGKCGQEMLAEGVEIPPIGIGDSTDETRRWGDAV